MPKPRIDDLVAELDRIRPVFTLRNSLIELWRSIIRLDEEYGGLVEGYRRTHDREDDDVIAITDPASIVNGAIRRLGSLDCRFRVAQDDVSTDSARKADRSSLFLRTARHRWNLDHRHAGGGLSRQGTLARFLAEDGQAYERRYLVPSRRDMPFTTCFLDPLECYPVWGTEDGLETCLRVYHCTQMTVRQLRDQWGKPGILAGRDPDDVIDVTNVYDKVYVSVIVEDKFVKQPTEHNYGRLPIQMTFTNGWLSTVSSGAVSIEEREAFRGRSIIADHVGTFMRLGQYHAAMRRALFKAVDPPRHIQLGENDQGVEIDDNPAGRTTTKDPQTKVNVLEGDRSQLTWIQSLLAAGRESVQADNLMLDPNTAKASGFDRVVASLEAQEVYAQIVEAIEDHESSGCEMVLGMFKEMVQSDDDAALIGAGIMAPDPSKPLSSVPLVERSGGRSIRQMFTAADVPEWIQVTASLETMSTVNVAQLYNQMVRLTDGGILSRYKALEMVNDPDPEAELERIRQDTVQKSPGYVQAVMPIDMLAGLEQRLHREEEAGNKLVASFVAAMIQKTQNDFLAAMAMPGTPTPPTGGAMPVEGGPAGPPSEMGGPGPMPPGIGTEAGQMPPETVGAGWRQQLEAGTAAGPGPMQPG